MIFLLLALPIWLKIFLNKDYRALLKQRLSPNLPPTQANNKRIWIHAVSVGEVKSLKNLIDNLIRECNNREIVLSVTTPAGFRLAQKEYGNISVICSPIDFSFTIKRFIKAINPCILILNELEMWPNWISITHKKKIPIVLINGRVSDTAFKRYKRFKFFLQIFFKKIDRILAQAEIYKDRFIELAIPAERITVCGNIKADEALNTLQNLPAKKDILAMLKIQESNHPGKKMIAIASSHLSDEKMIFPVVKALASQFFFILVPRHLDRLPEIEKNLAAEGIVYEIWSRITTTGRNTDMLVFDKMGALFATLKIADIVYMGGTLEKKIGGHNLYEPAALGKPIVGGEFYNNFPAIGEELSEKKIYHTIFSPAELQAFFEKTGQFNFQEISAAATATVASKIGSLQCTLKEIHAVLR